ncbi:MAG: GAF domain-containing protein [Williamsia herbipolensis]|nr:GAF domain-containing protein [Williamsia herbipolensis]
MSDQTSGVTTGTVPGHSVVAVADIVHSLTRPFDVAELMDAVADAARRGFAAQSSAVVVLDRTREPVRAEAVAAAGDASAVDDPSLSTSGPGLTAAGDGALAVIGDLDEQSDRWPRYREHARDAGIRAVHAFPIRFMDRPVGSVVVHTADPWGQNRPVMLGQLLADLAAIALSAGITDAQPATVEVVVDRLIRDNRTIATAVGITAATLDLDPVAARRELRRLAAAHQAPFAAHARALVDAHDRRPGDHGGLLSDPYTRS